MSKKEKTPSNASDRVIEIEAHRIPKLHENSVILLRKIVANDKNALEYDDYLKTFSLSGEEIGDFSIRVKQTIYKNVECYNVIAKSNGKIGNVPCGTEINAYVTRSLETLEQELHEFIKLENNPLNRRTIVTKENDVNFKITQMNVEATVSQLFPNYFAKKLDFYLNLKKGVSTAVYSVMNSLMIGFISEAANLLLQRLMIQQNFCEKLTLFTFDTSLNPCLVHYKALDKRHITIQDQTLEIIGLERHIESISDLPTTWQIYFTSDGHMINRVQIGSPAVMKAVEPPKPIELDEFLQLPTIEKKEIDWEADIELHSKYLDRKEELKNEYNQYLQDHPELRHLMADFVQSVLTMKPDDIVKYSAQFFAPYATKAAKNRLFPATNNPQSIPKH